MSDDELREAAERVVRSKVEGFAPWGDHRMASVAYDSDAEAVAARLLELLPPADEGEPADKDWMVARGWAWNDFLSFSFRADDGEGVFTDIDLNRLAGTFQIRTENGESVELHCKCHTRGDVRRIEAAFDLPVKEGN